METKTLLEAVEQVLEDTRKLTDAQREMQRLVEALLRVAQGAGDA